MPVIMSSAIRIRAATLDDAKMLWEWRNEPETRAASFNTQPIGYDEHARWFLKKIADPGTRFLIAADGEGRDVGYARLDIEGDGAEINLSVDKRHRGRGLGAAMIRAASRFAVEELKLRRVVAHIKPDNKASVAAFRRAGFAEKGTRTMGGEGAVEMIYEIGS